ncbi:hypothetical protein [Desulfovibrio sp. ZJ200]|uniref:hypothetical protein n=1 Tax=Desulfovibrio sp. ZJ200 TaxID=2709792 RepID=UPI0013EC93F5|nr:hypothetical protein [Desulfovibrio sp. ZJ200]
MTETGLWQPSREERQRLHIALDTILAEPGIRGLIVHAAALGADDGICFTAGCGHIRPSDIVGVFAEGRAKLLQEIRRQRERVCQSPEARR